MRIVHVGKFYPPEYHGGLESVVALLNDELVRRGVDVTAIVAAVNGPTRVDTHLGARIVRARSLGVAFSQPLAPALGRLVRAEPGDVVHLHHPNPLGDLAVLGERRPLVVTQHSDIVRQRLLRPVYGPLVRRVLARARAITVGSEQYLRASAELHGFEATTRVIPFGIDPARFALTPALAETARRLREEWGGRPVVLAVGRLVAYKGLDVLVRAARGLAATVVIVGSGPEEARLRALAGERGRVGGGDGGGPEVVFAGRVTDDLLVAHFHAADVFCLPSLTIAEAFGMVLLEAMACAKPLVTTRLPTGVSAINREGVTGLAVPPDDAGALREALGAVLGDGPRRDAMGRAARAVLEAEYTAARMGERFLSLYRELVAA